MQTVKTLVRLGRCPGWSESSLGAQAILVLSCAVSVISLLGKIQCSYLPALIIVLQEYNSSLQQKSIWLIRAVAGQRSSPESCFANKTRMFFRAKIKKRRITGPYYTDSFSKSMTFIHQYRSNFGEVDVAPAKNDKVNKLEKWQKLTAGLNPNHMHIFKPWKKRCAKLHKDRHETV